MGRGGDFFFMENLFWEIYFTTYRAPGEPEGF